MHRGGLSAALCVCAFAATASAGQIMQTVDFGPTTPDFTVPLTFDKYNGNLSDLVSVKVKAFLEVTGGSATVDNDGAAATTVTIDFGTTLSLSSTDVTLLDGAFQPVVSDVDVLANQMFSLAANDLDDPTIFNDDGGPDNATLSGALGSDMDMGFINSAFFSEYVGGGTFDIVIDADTAFQISGGSGVAGAFTPQVASGNVMVIYEFIPAPSSLALFALGGAVGIRRRR